jgi:hypothetical protein
MRLETLTLLRQCLYAQTLNIGATDFPETATAVLAARSDLEGAIVEASTEPWPGIDLPPGYTTDVTDIPDNNG